MIKMRTVNARISGCMIGKAAVQFSKEIEVQIFQASSGWLDSFKERNLISQKNSKCGIK
jgi:hypothetical protein